MKRAAVAMGALVVVAVGCGSGRDVVPETRDVRTEGSAGAAGGAGGGGNGVTQEGGYDYVARRPRAIVALAETRGMPREIGVAATDRVADQMEACAEDLAAKHQLVKGAARVAAKVGDDGNLAGLAVRIAPGAAVAANAILCFIAPVKSLTFPAASSADAGAGPPLDRGLALEATWEP